MGIKVATTLKAWAKKGGGGEGHIAVLFSPLPGAPIPEPEATEADLPVPGTEPVFWGDWKEWGRSTCPNISMSVGLAPVVAQRPGDSATLAKSPPPLS